MSSQLGRMASRADTWTHNDIHLEKMTSHKGYLAALCFNGSI